ncbi:MAG TPA: efflux RND transporter periplasmic adaptor subunit, partial [Burkholderiales bacterium]|nr:efflux RND transporter periplasmic adaptor subunit [Burkholderiales bacterium]
MEPADLSKLKIDRSALSLGAPRKRRRWTRIALVAFAVAAAGGFAAIRLYAPPVVETTIVANAYPSLNYTLLNATGYVVPQ